MTKQTEALRMAIEWLDNQQLGYSGHSVRKACQEALAETQDGNCCTEGCIKCDARKVLAETQKPILIQWYDEEEDVWENTDERHYQHYADTGHKIRFLYTTPSREWQSLSDAEIGRLAVFDGLHHVEIPLLAKFILAIEQALKEKNNA